MKPILGAAAIIIAFFLAISLILLWTNYPWG